MKGILPIFDYNPSESGRPLIIAGPCGAETEEQTLATARGLVSRGVGAFRAGLWKPRTRPGCFEGVGERGLPWLRKVKEQTGMQVATEVANASHVAQAIEGGVDILWIGARTTANPFAVQEVADAIAEMQEKKGMDIPVMVKNPISPDIELWIGALQRMSNAGVKRMAAVHRGFSVYGKHLYRNMPQWQIPMELRRRMPDLQLICDPSHIGGSRELILPISQQALDMGFDGLIIESHCCPDEALSDAAQQITPSCLGEIIDKLEVRMQTEAQDGLALYREEIDALDDELLDILARRMALSRRIGEYKKERRMPVVQPQRYGEMMANRLAKAECLGLAPEFVRTLHAAIHEESVRQQLEL